MSKLAFEFNRPFISSLIIFTLMSISLVSQADETDQKVFFELECRKIGLEEAKEGVYGPFEFSFKSHSEGLTQFCTKEEGRTNGRNDNGVMVSYATIESLSKACIKDLGTPKIHALKNFWSEPMLSVYCVFKTSD